MTVMSPTRALPGQTFWPAAPAASTVPAVRADTPTSTVPAVPTQAGAGSVRPTPGGPTGLRGRGAGPVPSLRELGVDPSTLGTGRPSTFAGASASAEPGGERVLRCAGSALCAAQHLLEQAAPDPLTLAQVVEADPVLTLRVLHHANLTAPTGYHADNARDAISALGPDALGALVDELLVSGDLRPMPGLWRVLARALTCEELSADRMGYTIGLLSGLADEVGVPASAVLEVAGVSREVADAIRYGTGPLGPVLRAVLAYERNDAAGVARTGVAAVDVYDAYLRGATEAMATAQALGSR